jgi:striatin 1/3/4
MKAKIAKQEGECRQAKRINEQLERQVRMLELALKNERAKAKGVQSTPNGVPPEDANTTNGEKQSKPAFVPHNSFLETADPQDPSEKDREQYLDNTTKYLKNCMKEIQYLLTPPQHPPPPHMLPNGSFAGLPDAPLSVEDMYARHQRSSRGPGQVLPQPSAMPNHQPPPIPNSLPQTSRQQQEELGQTLGYPEYTSTNQQQSDILQSQQPSTNYEEQVENITHTYDSRGRPVPDPNAQQQTREIVDPDNWQFDEEPPPPPEIPPPEVPPPRRPDTDLFPSAVSASQLSAKSPPRTGPSPHARRKSSHGASGMERRRSSQGSKGRTHDGAEIAIVNDPNLFKVKFALRGHLDVVRSVIFSGGGSPSEPEVCTAGDDGTIKRWIVPATYQNYNPTNNAADLDIAAYFTHRGHEGVVTCLAACPASTGFSTGGRANGDGWIFSGGQDCTVRVWERGRVDPKATLEGHTDAVWAICVLPASVGVVFGTQSSNFGGPDRVLLVSGSADGTVKIWAVSAPPQNSSPASGSRRGVGGSRRHSVTSGSNFPSSPQPSFASSTPFSSTLVHSIERPDVPNASPTSICPLSPSGETFVVSYSDSSVLIFDTRTGEEIVGMASNETYDGTTNTSINAVVATSLGLEGSGASGIDASRGLEAEEVGGGATGSREGVEGIVITGHEDRFVRFFDANSGKSSISSPHLCYPLLTTAVQVKEHTPWSPTTSPPSQPSPSPKTEGN